MTRDPSGRLRRAAVTPQALRTWFGQRITRLRADGLRRSLSIEPATRIRLIKATLAGTLAWVAVDLLNSPRPALGSLAAILVVQVTVRATLARSIQLTVGVTVGLILAVGVGHYFGQHWWTIGLIILGGLVTGELLRLGPFAAQAAISALLAFSLGASYGLARITDTLVGAFIGVVVNALIAPPTVAAQTSVRLRQEAEELGALLIDIGGGLADGLQRQRVRSWLDRARERAAGIYGALDELDQVEESLAFNPLGRTTDEHLHRLRESGRALEHLAVQVRGMTRALIDLTRLPTGAEAVNDVLRLAGPALVEGGHAAAAFGRLQADPSSAADRAHAVSAVTEAAKARKRAVETIGRRQADRRLSADQSLLLSSLLVDTAHLMHEVDVEHGAHVAAVTGTDPAG